MVERQFCKLDAMGSSPFTGSITIDGVETFPVFCSLILNFLSQVAFAYGRLPDRLVRARNSE